MCEFDGTLDHPQCYFHTALTEKDIVTIIKKLTGEPAGKCGQIGLKPFCKINPAPKVNKPNPPLVFTLYASFVLWFRNICHFRKAISSGPGSPKGQP